MVRDVWVDGTTNRVGGAGSADQKKQAIEFHTVAVMGERRGGTRYFALDVSDATYFQATTAATPRTTVPRFLWMYPQPSDRQTVTSGETYTDFLPVRPAHRSGPPRDHRHRRAHRDGPQSAQHHRREHLGRVRGALGRHALGRLRPHVPARARRAHGGRLDRQGALRLQLPRRRRLGHRRRPAARAQVPGGGHGRHGHVGPERAAPPLARERRLLRHGHLRGHRRAAVGAPLQPARQARRHHEEGHQLVRRADHVDARLRRPAVLLHHRQRGPAAGVLPRGGRHRRPLQPARHQRRPVRCGQPARLRPARLHGDDVLRLEPDLRGRRRGRLTAPSTYGRAPARSPPRAPSRTPAACTAGGSARMRDHLPQRRRLEHPVGHPRLHARRGRLRLRADDRHVGRRVAHHRHHAGQLVRVAAGLRGGRLARHLLHRRRRADLRPEPARGLPGHRRHHRRHRRHRRRRRRHAAEPALALRREGLGALVRPRRPR